MYTTSHSGVAGEDVCGERLVHVYMEGYTSHPLPGGVWRMSSGIIQ